MDVFGDKLVEKENINTNEQMRVKDKNGSSITKVKITDTIMITD